MKILKHILKGGIAIIIIIVLTTVFCNLLVKSSTKSQIFNDLDLIPYNKVGLVLGTSKYASSGGPNIYFKNRIQAAVDLFKAEKISFILVSGDNRVANYNEPIQMQKALMKLGIPEDRIVLDYAGFRTLDSVVRSKKVFGQNSITIISQKFHNQRALFVANYNEMNAIGYSAGGVNLRWGYRTMLREKLAKVKVILDILLSVQPKFLGEKEQIGEALN